MAPTWAAQLQQRLHQSNFFTKKEAYKDFLTFLLGSLGFHQDHSQMPYLKGFLFQVQKLSRLEHILGVLARFCTNARSDTLTAGTVAVWKHRGTPLLHVSSTKERWGCTKAVVITNITAWAPPYLLSYSHLLQDFLGSLPSCMKDIWAHSLSIIKKQEKPIPHLHT